MASPNNRNALSNVKVRQALSYAINRDNVIQVTAVRRFRLR